MTGNRRGQLALWVIHHPVGSSLIGAAVVLAGLVALGRLGVDLLPHLDHPQIRARVLEPGVSPAVMEARVTRPLEVQLAATAGVSAVESTTVEGGAVVSLSFPRDRDLDAALRDAGSRLDRVRRYLPTNIDPPIVYKADPSQTPVNEFIISSASQNPVTLRGWCDDVFARWFLDLPGVAAVEVDGGLLREIHVQPDQPRLAALGLSPRDLIRAIESGSGAEPGRHVTMSQLEFGGRSAGRLTSLDAIAALPLRLADGDSVQLSEVARVVDTHADSHLRVRNNGVAGVRIAIRKQPDASTVKVSGAVKTRLDWLRANRSIPPDIEITKVADQSDYVRSVLRSAGAAVVSGALLAMLVVCLFFGSLRHSLVIVSAIPISIMAAFIVMGVTGLTLNIMTLGGLALCAGMLVDGTILMFEDIMRRRRRGESPVQAGCNAAAAVDSTLVAGATMRLAAVLPLLFVGGLAGLLFRELVIAIIAAIVTATVTALVLVPGLAARTSDAGGNARRRVRAGAFMEWLRRVYLHVLDRVLARPLWVVLAMVAALTLVLPQFFSSRQSFLPRMDDGIIHVDVTGDPGASEEAMDVAVATVERLIRDQGEVANVLALVGGSIFGRTVVESANRSTLQVRLLPRAKRQRSVQAWIGGFRAAVKKARPTGFSLKAQATGILDLRFDRSDADIGIRLQGPDPAVLTMLADTVLRRIRDVPGLDNAGHSAAEQRSELAVTVDHDRAAALDLTIADVGRSVQVAMEGVVAGDFLDGDRAYPIRLRLSRGEAGRVEAVESVLLFGAGDRGAPVYLRDVASVGFEAVPAQIRRENQRRIVEVTASVTDDAATGSVIDAVRGRLAGLGLPAGYTLYYSGAEQALEPGRRMAWLLLALALLLVWVVMAAQCRSLRNASLALFGVPFAAIGVAAGLRITGLDLSMPVWFGMIMLTGLVASNSILLVAHIEMLCRRGSEPVAAIREAGSQRLRPVLMTTSITAAGMLPLALGLGDGAELLQPVAVTIVSGLGFAALVSLLLVPAMYRLLHARRSRGAASRKNPGTG